MSEKSGLRVSIDTSRAAQESNMEDVKTTQESGKTADAPWKFYSEDGLKQLLLLLGVPVEMLLSKDVKFCSSLLDGLYASNKENVMKKVAELNGFHEEARLVPDIHLLSPLHPPSQLESEDKKRSKLDVKAPSRWNGGSLYEWRRWVRTFMDIAEELKYEESEGIKRLRRYTDSSPDYAVIEMLIDEGLSYQQVMQEIEGRKIIEKSGDVQRFLDDVTQGSNTVAIYLSEFEKNAQEIERVENTKFSLAEKIRAFEKGLWIKIRLRIPVSHINIDKSSFRNYTNSILQVEAQVKREIASFKELRDEKRKPGKDGSKKSTNDKSLASVNEKRKECWAWRKFGRCKFGSRCHYNKDHTSDVQGKIKEDQNEDAENVDKSYLDAVDNVLLNGGETRIFIDSACSRSKTNNQNILSYYEDHKEIIKSFGIGNQSVMSVGQGVLGLSSKENPNLILMLRMDYAPNSAYTLISQGELDRKGFEFQSKEKTMKVFKNNRLLMTADLQDDFFNLYQLNMEIVQVPEEKARDYLKRQNFAFSDVQRKKRTDLITLLHNRLCHMNLKDMAKTFDLVNLPDELDGAKIRNDNFRCKSCLDVKPLRVVKLRKLEPRAGSETPEHEASSSRDVTVYTDMSGPFKTSLGGNKYLKVNFISGIGMLYARMVRSRQSKDIVEDSKIVLRELEKYKWKVAKHVSDNAKEFRSEEFKNLSEEFMYDQEYTAGYDSNANAFAERSVRTILEPARVIMRHMNVPWCFIDYAVDFVVFLKNRVVRRHCGKVIIPLEQLTARRVSIPPHLYTFGCLAWAKKPGDPSDSYNRECMYLGPGEMMEQRGALFLDMKTVVEGKRENKVFVSRQYKIFEDSPCFERSDDLDNIFEEHEDDEDFVEGQKGEDQEGANQEGDSENPLQQSEIEALGSQETVVEVSTAVKRKAPVRRSERLKKKRASLEEWSWQDYHPDFWDMPAVDFQSAINGTERKEWMKAMQDEMDSINAFDTYQVLSQEEFDEMSKSRPLAGGKIFNTRFVLDLKRDGRKKARLVVQAYDYKATTIQELYSPVCRMDSFFLLLNIGVSKQWGFRGWDAKNAFLQRRLPSELFCVVRSPDKKTLWQLRAPLYGLPLASKTWNDGVNEVMGNSGWIQTYFDPCCYVFFFEDELSAMVIIHVDDFFASGEEKSLDNLDEILMGNFQMKRSPPTEYLGFNLEFHDDHCLVSMKSYIEKLNAKFNPENIKECMPYSPIQVKNLKRGDRNGNELKALLGALLYIVKVRIELMFIVSCLCQFNNAFSDEIYSMALRIVHYLNQTKDYSLKISKNDFQLNVYCDASFGQESDRKSRDGICILLGKSFLFALSKKQSIVVDSSTYAEVKACLKGVREAEYFYNILEYLGFMQEKIHVNQDNKSAIRIMSTADFTGRSKHFDVAFLYVTDRIKSGLLELFYKQSREMFADCLTKCVGRNMFYDFMKFVGIGVHNRPSNQEGA